MHSLILLQIFMTYSEENKFSLFAYFDTVDAGGLYLTTLVTIHFLYKITNEY